MPMPFLDFVLLLQNRLFLVTAQEALHMEYEGLKIA